MRDFINKTALSIAFIFFILLVQAQISESDNGPYTQLEHQ